MLFLRQRISSVKLSYESVMAQVINFKMERLRTLEDHLSKAEERYDGQEKLGAYLCCINLSHFTS